MKSKTLYRTMGVREALSLAEAGVQGIEVQQGPRTWSNPQYLYECTPDDDDYINVNQATVYRVAVE
jgi:hypothetical protein